MRRVGDYRDTCGACVHFIRDEEREREQAEIWPWTAGWPVHACGLSGQVVDAGDSPNACRSAAEGCTGFERGARLMAEYIVDTTDGIYNARTTGELVRCRDCVHFMRCPMRKGDGSGYCWQARKRETVRHGSRD